MQDFLKSIKAAIDDPDLSSEIIKEMKKRDDRQQESDEKVESLENQLSDIKKEYGAFRRDYSALMKKAKEDSDETVERLSEAEKIRAETMEEKAQVAFLRGQGEAAYNLAKLVFGNKVVMENTYSTSSSQLRGDGNYADVRLGDSKSQTIATQEE